MDHCSSSSSSNFITGTDTTGRTNLNVENAHVHDNCCFLCCSTIPRPSRSSSSKSGTPTPIPSVISSLVNLLQLDHQDTATTTGSSSVGSSYIEFFSSSTYCVRCLDLLNHIHSLSVLLESERKYICRLLVRNYGQVLSTATPNIHEQQIPKSQPILLTNPSPLHQENDNTSHIFKCLENLIPDAPVPVPTAQKELPLLISQNPNFGPEPEPEEMLIIVQPKIENFEFEFQLNHQNCEDSDTATGDGFQEFQIQNHDHLIGPDFDQEQEHEMQEEEPTSPEPSDFPTTSRSPSGWIRAIKNSTYTRTKFRYTPTPEPGTSASARPKKPTKLTQILKNFECSICGSRFARGSHLRTHRELHSGTKQSTSGPGHSCSYCLKVYKDPWSLRFHLLNQHGDKIKNPYSSHLVQCDVEGCEESFNTKINYSRHMKIHDPLIRPENICTLCKIGFTRSDRMANHRTKYHSNPQ